MNSLPSWQEGRTRAWTFEWPCQVGHKLAVHWSHLIADDVLLQVLVTVRIEIVGEDTATLLRSWYCERSDSCEYVRDDVLGLEESDESGMLCM